jgi:hypothetical protein
MGVGSIMKMLQGPVEDIVGRITQQLNMVEDVQQQINGFAGGIPNVWVGEDANAFLEEVQTRVIPEIADLIAAIGGMPGGLGNMMSIMHSADSESRGLVGGLGDMFGGIF